MSPKFNLIYKLKRNQKLSTKKKLKLRKKYKPKKKASKKRKKYIIIFLTLLLIIICFITFQKIFHKKIFRYINKHPQDDLTLVSAYYRMKSKHSRESYLRRINNIVLLNKSFVIFSNKEFMPTLKEMRPKELHYKTIFIEKEIEEFYSYKNFYKEFNEAFKHDIENRYHTVPLYMVWAEKTMFLKEAIEKNYFKSKCFYWIDIGYFHQEKKNDMEKYINKWPTTKKCLEDNRIIIGQVRHFSNEDKQKILNFSHSAHKKLKRKTNVAGGFFGGQIENTLKFINLYYETLKLFIEHKLFIGKDQNIYTYMAFAHPEIINLIKFGGGRFHDFKFILMDK